MTTTRGGAGRQTGAAAVSRVLPPTFRKKREEWGTPCWEGAGEIKSRVSRVLPPTFRKIAKGGAALVGRVPARSKAGCRDSCLPPFAKNARVGHPLLGGCRRDQKPGVEGLASHLSKIAKGGAAVVGVVPTRSRAGCRDSCLSHPSQKTRRVGHPLLGGCRRDQKPGVGSCLPPFDFAQGRLFRKPRKVGHPLS